MSDDIKTAIAAATKSVTKSWKTAKRTSVDRNDRVSRARISRLRYRAPNRVTIRDVAFRVMEEAYNKASSNGRYYANARQIMYAARPTILAECDADEFNDVYFTQTLLKDYIEKFSPSWKVVWDARGNLIEPHTDHRVPLGGAGVEKYRKDWHSQIDRHTPEIEPQIDTSGPANRFANVLFIEKEGFAEILSDAGISKRYDMAIMSTKGIPVKAACDLISSMHVTGVQTFVLHDFDLDGFKITRTLRRGTRLSFGTEVIDLGLRLEDIEGLPSEPVSYTQQKHPASYLRISGASNEECEFLVSGGHAGRWVGQRVEINAMTSEQLITWLERKFDAHKVRKLVPDLETLKETYSRAIFLQRMQREIEQIESDLEDEKHKPPTKLSSTVKAMLKKTPTLTWDDAIWQLADDADDPEDN